VRVRWENGRIHRKLLTICGNGSYPWHVSSSRTPSRGLTRAIGHGAADDRGSWASSPQSRSRMRAQRSRDTAPELAIRRLLFSAGLRYRVDCRPMPGIRRRADILFSSAKVAVFIDGCFWHNCPEHRSNPKANGDWWREKLAHNQERDQDTDQLLEQAGWLPIRVWEHDDAATAATRIIGIVRGRKTMRQRTS
jgi:DNA mismatch endonuclease (patch repair protein)